MKYFFIFILLLLLFSCDNGENKTPENPELFSINLLQVAREQKGYTNYLDSLEHADIYRLGELLDTDNKRKAFWINTYNAFVQIRIQQHKIKFRTEEAFFTDRDFIIAGQNISLNDIRDFFLRGIKDNTLDKLIKLQVSKNDPRIHFALNCSELACPPINHYESKNIDYQLNLAEKFFIRTNSNYSIELDQVKTSELLKQFESDFGGQEGIMELLKKYLGFEVSAQTEIEYAPYRWTPYSETE